MGSRSYLDLGLACCPGFAHAKKSSCGEVGINPEETIILDRAFISTK